LNRSTQEIMWTTVIFDKISKLSHVENMVQVAGSIDPLTICWDWIL